MARHSREAVADAFWSKAGGREKFGTPADIDRAAGRVAPVAIRRISGLHTDAVSAFLEQIDANPWFCVTPRLLRGCLIADAGKAIILVERDDPEDEQRMTVAHEVAHLLLHYLKLRDEAVTAFGQGIVAVLDRIRPPTLGEHMSSALRNVPIEPFRHSMDRLKSHTRDVNTLEDEADDLAVELLAPWRELSRLKGATPGILRERFGLPAPVATCLADLIKPSGTSVGVLGLFGQK